LTETVKHFDEILMTSPALGSIGELKPLKELYAACELMPDPKLSGMMAYIDRYNEEVQILGRFTAAADRIVSEFPMDQKWPDAGVYDNLHQRTQTAITRIPESHARHVTRYGASPSGQRLQTDIQSAKARGSAMMELYSGASALRRLVGQGEWRNAEKVAAEIARSTRIRGNSGRGEEQGPGVY
jgi:hypothetical protein